MGDPLDPRRRGVSAAAGGGVTPVVAVDLKSAAFVADAWGGGVPVARLDLERGEDDLIVHISLERAGDDAPVLVIRAIGERRDVIRRLRVRPWRRNP